MESRKETSLAFGERATLKISESAQERRFGLEIDWWSATALTL